MCYNVVTKTKEHSMLKYRRIKVMENLYDTMAGRDKVLRRFSVFDNAGVDLRDCTNLDEALDKAQIDYGATKSPIYLANGTEIKDHYCVTKSDDGKPLGVVGKDYNPVHNRDAFEIADDLVQFNGFKYEAGGASRGSRCTVDDSKTFMVLRGDDIRMGVGDGDIFNTFVVFRNSFDGTSGIQYRFLMQRLVCLNGMTRYLGGKKSQLWINVQHTNSVDSRLTIAKDAVKKYAKEVEAIRAEANAFIDTPLSRKEFENEIIPQILGVMKLNPGNEKEGNIAKINQVIQKALSAYDAEDTANYNGTAYKVILAMTDLESHLEPFRDTQNASLYMNRTLSGMMWTTAIANYIAQTRNVFRKLNH